MAGEMGRGMRWPTFTTRLLQTFALYGQLVGLIWWVDHCDGVSSPRWPALEYKSDRAFYPLMVSFSKFPFHDVYEKLPSSSMGSRMSLGAGGRKGQQSSSGTSKGRDWRHPESGQKANGHGNRICQLLRSSKLTDGGRRLMRLPKMRKLLKYCGLL